MAPILIFDNLNLLFPGKTLALEHFSRAKKLQGIEILK